MCRDNKSLTIFRKIVNRPRPYDHMDIKPLKGHKHGESFPSRHSVSACIIALICFYANTYIGIFACIIAIIVSLTRIFSGVHHISDVFAAIIIAITVIVLIMIIFDLDFLTTSNFLPH